MYVCSNGGTLTAHTYTKTHTISSAIHTYILTHHPHICQALCTLHAALVITPPPMPSHQHTLQDTLIHAAAALQGGVLSMLCEVMFPATAHDALHAPATHNYHHFDNNANQHDVVVQASAVGLLAHAVDVGLVVVGEHEELLLVVLLCVASSPHRVVRDAALGLAKVWWWWWWWWCM